MRIKKFLPLILSAAFALCVLLLCVYFSYNALNQLPNVSQFNYDYASAKEPMTVEDIQSFQERVTYDRLGFCCELSDATVKEETVTPVLTNELYFSVREIELNGEGITENNVKKGERVAVIGDTLALKLFFNTDAVGKTITMNGEKYTIAGVFKEPKGILNDMSSDGKQRVYIPFTSYGDYKSCAVHSICTHNGSIAAPALDQMNLTNYSKIDYSEKEKIIKNFLHIDFLMLFAALCFFVLKIWYRLCGKFNSQIKDDLKINYFKKSLRSVPSRYILLVLTAVGFPALLIAIFALADFSIYIPSQYTPYDNIFEISHYYQTILNANHTSNALALGGNAYIFNMYSASFSVLFWLTLILALSLIIFSVCLNKIAFGKK